MGTKSLTFDTAYTYVRNALVTAYPTIKTSSVLVEKTESIPFVMFFPMDSTDVVDAETLTRNESVFELDIQADITASKMTECRGITNVINGAMKTLGFTRTYEAPIENIDRNLNRMVARYNRVVCGSDTVTI